MPPMNDVALMGIGCCYLSWASMYTVVVVVVALCCGAVWCLFFLHTKCGVSREANRNACRPNMRASFRIRSSALLRQSKLRCGLIPQTRRSYAKRHTVERIPTTTAREEVVSAPSNTKLTDELKERRRRKRVKLLWIVRALTFPFYIFVRQFP